MDGDSRLLKALEAVNMAGSQADYPEEGELMETLLAFELLAT